MVTQFKPQSNAFQKIKLASLILFVATVFSFGCNSDEDKDIPESSTQGPVTNVNGNMPDTSNTVDLNSKPIDSTHVAGDSLK